MLSVNHMLNQQDDQSSQTQSRSRLDITDLLCDQSSEILPTPTLSTHSSPSSTNSVLSLPSFDLDNSITNYHHPSSGGKASSNYNLIGTLLPSPYDETKSDDCVKIPYRRRNYGNHYYQHRIMLMTDTQEGEQPTTCLFQQQQEEEENDNDPTNCYYYNNNNKMIKAKRRRASNKQLQVLNRVFEHTFFPSTQLRTQLGRQLNMSPRTVQIWFQNRRQAIRTKERQQLQQQQQQYHHHYHHRHHLPPPQQQQLLQEQRYQNIFY
ncbi:uncharacterized protein BX664DRAFT_320033 [Halteromyces radiatus]|uniref:uncharacterized protein n=1 Tax=Halteromyces radiatus TaxID=101107 RepID=UPI00221FD73D|nr:uncharacterized protein BX664DRAFT_320033 [Halteromyces radiatus]KAI8098962.1 hypothetical protein BX664DRAFT_320033 [Halteromyces radiatus]